MSKASSDSDVVNLQPGQAIHAELIQLATIDAAKWFTNREEFETCCDVDLPTFTSDSFFMSSGPVQLSPSSQEIKSKDAKILRSIYKILSYFPGRLEDVAVVKPLDVSLVQSVWISYPAQLSVLYIFVQAENPFIVVDIDEDLYEVTCEQFSAAFITNGLPHIFANKNNTSSAFVRVLFYSDKKSNTLASQIDSLLEPKTSDG